MATTLRYGPGDHGRPMTFDEFMEGDYEEGHKYELIRGRLYVSPQPRFSHDWIEQYVLDRLKQYARETGSAINKATNKARVFVSDADPEDVTASEPDVAGYQGFPLDRKWDVDWRDVSPILVAEVLSQDDPDKDLVRNVDLYLQVPSIQEYWAVENRDEPGRPTLRVHRRRGDDWTILEFGPDDVYTTDLLSGFQLPVTPSEN